MSVELGGGSAKDHSLAEALRVAGPHAVEYLYETFATSLFDYCASVLDDPLAACDTVQDGLVAVDAPDGELMPVVIAALSALPGREREALNLAFRHAITGADLARVLGLARDV